MNNLRQLNCQQIFYGMKFPSQWLRTMVLSLWKGRWWKWRHHQTTVVHNALSFRPLPLFHEEREINGISSMRQRMYDCPFLWLTLFSFLTSEWRSFHNITSINSTLQANPNRVSSLGHDYFLLNNFQFTNRYTIQCHMVQLLMVS
jgi:hypothetical protein